MIKYIYKSIIDSSISWIIGGILIIWGIYANGWIRIGIGFLLIYGEIITAINNYKLDRQIEKWLKENNGKFLFFYPTKKHIQQRIKNEILPLFDENVLQAFYEGPKIIGDLEKINFLLKRVMLFDKRIRPNNPAIIEIKNGEFIIKDELSFLVNLKDNTDIDKKGLQKRIKKACS